MTEASVRCPALYQINTQILLEERGETLGRRATLDDVPDPFLDEIARRGFDWVWLLGVWQTGEAARRISRSNAKLRTSFAETLPDLREDDITGSPFAVREWTTRQDFGGDDALARIRRRMADRGLRLLLDFVPNHVAPDHPWVRSHPEYFISGAEDDLAREPQNYCRVNTGHGSMILAYGRDPYFDGWPDTLQLNYRHAGLVKAQIAELRHIAERCDGLRCDMAMLLQPDVFTRTWGKRAEPRDGSPAWDRPFWPEAIGAIRQQHPRFLFVAEVYWGLEWQLQQAGFDFTYDKRLYDRLMGRAAKPVRDHLRADMAFQEHSMRFLENHDEPRALAAFPDPIYRPAAVVTYLTSGLRLFHEGQIEGRRTHISMHLGRRPAEKAIPKVKDFYERLFAILKRPEAQTGRWRLLEPRQAWEGNPTHDQFIAMSWDADGRRLIAIANYGPSQAQCYVTITAPGIAGRQFALIDLLSNTRYDRSGDDLAGRGLYLDMPAWGCHVFELR
jgi:glycosidase